MTRWVVPMVLGASLAPATALAVTPSSVVRSDSVGGFRVRADGTLGGAVRVFGQPTTKERRGRFGTCVVTWARVGLRMTFSNLVNRNPCGARTGLFGSALVTDTRWRTASGLRIGAPVAAIRQRHPGARLTNDRGPGWWWLVERRTPIGVHGLEALVRDRRVKAFRVTYPKGGE